MLYGFLVYHPCLSHSSKTYNLLWYSVVLNWTIHMSHCTRKKCGCTMDGTVIPNFLQGHVDRAWILSTAKEFNTDTCNKSSSETIWYFYKISSSKLGCSLYMHRYGNCSQHVMNHILQFRCSYIRYNKPVINVWLIQFNNYKK